MTSETGFGILSSFSSTLVVLFSVSNLCSGKCVENAWSKCHLFSHKSLFISKHGYFNFLRMILILCRIFRRIFWKHKNNVHNEVFFQKARFCAFSIFTVLEKESWWTQIWSKMDVWSLKMISEKFSTNWHPSLEREKIIAKFSVRWPVSQVINGSNDAIHH